MNIQVKIVRVGDSLGVALPEDVLSVLGATEGDTLVLARDARGFALRRIDPESERQLKVGRDVMRKRHGTLRALAKE